MFRNIHLDIPKRWLGPPQAPVSVLTHPGALGMVDNSRTGWERVVHDDSPHNGCRCDFYLVGLIVAQADRQGTLRVRIYQEDTPTLTGKSDSQIFTITDEILKLVSWLNENEIQAVAMEATGVYWKPIYNLLEDEPFKTLDVNLLGVYGNGISNQINNGIKE